MSASPREQRMAQLIAAPPTPPFEVGDFSYVEESAKKHDIIICPLCYRDPDRELHRFRVGDNRARHFFEAHGPDDVGRPVAELVAELRDDPDHVESPRQATDGAVARYERAKAAARDREQAGLDAFGGGGEVGR